VSGVRRESPEGESAQRRLRVHLAIIDRGVAPVVARYREHIECRPGCSECCHQSFRVSELEGEMLRAGLAAAAPEVQREVSARAAAYQSGRGEACPALAGDGTCQVYEHRPRICRKYGIPLWHPDRPEELSTCRLNFRGVDDLEAALIVEPQAGWAEDWIALREQLGLGPQDNRSIAGWLREG
jgi:Fe-S-cluster containining protein